MPKIITVRRNFVVPSLLEIEEPEFAQQYGLGVYWAMYGDEQGNGPQTDCYIIENISRNLYAGRYDYPTSPWFAHNGFYLGMLHGGFLVRPTDTLVVLTDPDFTKGYIVGRDYCFVEAPLEGRVLSDRLFNEAIYSLAQEYRTFHDTAEVIRYSLGCRIGELSGAFLPQVDTVF